VQVLRHRIALLLKVLVKLDLGIEWQCLELSPDGIVQQILPLYKFLVATMHAGDDEVLELEVR